MNRTYLITYNLLNPSRNYKAVVDRIKQYQTWAKLGESVFLVLTDNDPVQIRDFVAAVMDPNDQIWVGAAPAPSAWRGLPEIVSNWVLTNQKS